MTNFVDFKGQDNKLFNMVPTKKNKKKVIWQSQDITIYFLLQLWNMRGYTIFFIGCFPKNQPSPGHCSCIFGPNPVERLGLDGLRDALWPYTESKSQLI